MPDRDVSVEPNQSRWTEGDVSERLQVVRDELLGFLKARTRLDWFKNRLRWRKSRQYIWPGAPDGLDALLDEAIERDGGVEAFKDYLRTRQAGITNAIERYNTAVRRLLEQEEGKPAREFGPRARTELRQRRITFQGTRDELLRRARSMTGETGAEILPELLSLRLAILNEDVRDQIFSEVAAILADEAADASDAMPAEQRCNLAESIELRLRSNDQYHVARLLAENYAEARRMMDVEGLMERYEALFRAEAAEPGAEPGREELVEVLRRVLLDKVKALEAVFPMTEETHRRERRLLREPGDPEPSD